MIDSQRLADPVGAGHTRPGTHAVRELNASIRKTSQSVLVRAGSFAIFPAHGKRRDDRDDLLVLLTHFSNYRTGDTGRVSSRWKGAQK
ncbi:hypothetical protein CKO51_16555 [Rhodopirellula sp. SM50]|nr:hypothetical protein CKO51_16555 [Rhodopirellula sp. SM50]